MDQADEQIVVNAVAEVRQAKPILGNPGRQM